MSRHATLGSRRQRTLPSCALALLLGALPSLAAAQGAGPQSAAGDAGDRAGGLFGEPRVIARVVDLGTRTVGDGGDVKSGFYPELSNMPTGAGWISIGPGYRQRFLGDAAIVDASAAVSWRAYKMAQARFELPHLFQSRLAVGSQVRWQDLTQVTYFGEGQNSRGADRSEYRLQSANVVGYATLHPVKGFSIGYSAGWLARPSILTPAGSFKRGNPATQTVFSDDPVFRLAEQPNYAYAEAALAYDTRDHRSHPTRGGVYRLAWTGYSDRDTETFSFQRSEAEGAMFVPVAGSRVVLAMHGWVVGSHTTEGRTVPFYLEPSLGGATTLRGDADFRFHDRSLLLCTLESRIALFAHVDAAVFADAGSVAPRVSDLTLERRSYGIGFRMHSQKATFARLDLAHGAEGWRLLLRLTDPLHLSRLSRRTAAAPFVP
jgi:hypothetical protein